MKFLLVGADHGPYETLYPLTHDKAFCIFKFIGQPIDWLSHLSTQKYDGIVLSTSRSVKGSKLEIKCLLAANSLNLFTVVIEDYPFNFLPNSDLKVNLLLVENEIVKNVYKNKFGNSIDEIDEGSLIRYSRIANRANNLVPQGSNVLWIGQPETDPSIKVLEQILPILKKLNIVMYFKAHPRDGGYSVGNYHMLFSRFKEYFFDVSGWTIEQCFALAPSLLITRFSSLATMAGYYGIPSLHVLYSKIEKDYFRKMYPNRIPAICEMGASFLIRSENDQEQELLKALTDENARNTVFKNFAKYYRKDEYFSNKIVEKILSEANRFNK